MMSWLITLLLAANAPYTETNIDGLYIGSINPLNGRASVNVRQIDLNQDGKSDLAFPDRILFQQDGTFTRTSLIDIPEADRGPEVDFFKDTLYLKFPDGLKTYRYVDNAWKLLLDASIAWPHQQLRSSSDPELSMPATFERFVYDIDDDGIPELIFPMQDGLHIVRSKEGIYKTTLPYQVFPESTLLALDSIITTSNLARYLTFPDQHIVFHATIDKGILSVITKSAGSDNTIQFETTTHSISSLNGELEFNLTGSPVLSSKYPNSIQPCRLNPDSRIDFAGGSLDYASTLAILTPVYTSTIFTTPDDRPQTFRTKSFTPHTLFTDVNHDEYYDLIQETTHITNGGLRETLNRFTTQKKFKHTIAVHLQNRAFQFSRAPDFSKTLTIKLDQTPIRLSNMFQRYQAGKLINFTGDFNNDGQNDLIAQTSETKLALYLFSDSSFPDKPNFLIPINASETFHVIDLNLDGYFDIVFQRSPDEDSETPAPARVLLFRGDTQ